MKVWVTVSLLKIALTYNLFWSISFFLLFQSCMACFHSS